MRDLKNTPLLFYAKRQTGHPMKFASCPHPWQAILPIIRIIGGREPRDNELFIPFPARPKHLKPIQRSLPMFKRQLSEKCPLRVNVEDLGTPIFSRELQTVYNQGAFDTPKSKWSVRRVSR